MIKEINDQILDQSCEKARSIERQRMHYNFHDSYAEPVQRLINAIEPYSYIQPHMHKDPDKLEIFLVLRGRFLVLIFDDSGTITHHSILDANAGNYGIEIHPGLYHMISSLESNSVAYEIKNGPYDPAGDKRWAPWAPAEGSEGCRKYLQQCFDEVGIYPKV